MPGTPTYPGVYVEEIPSGIRTIAGVATSITAFLGRAVRGPVNDATTITSYADFERTFGGIKHDFSMSYAVRDFYQNGGKQAVIVRLFHDPETVGIMANVEIKVGEHGLIQAISPGSWGQYIRCGLDFRVSVAEINSAGLSEKPWNIFNLTVRDASTGNIEVFRKLSATDSLRRIDQVLQTQSQLVEWKDAYEGDAVQNFQNELEELYTKDITPAREKLTKAEKMPNGTEEERLIRAEAIQDAKKLLVKAFATTELRDSISEAENKVADNRKKLDDAYANALSDTEIKQAEENLKKAIEALENASKILADTTTDGADLFYGDFFPSGGEDAKTGIYALEKTDLFNLLCIPPDKKTGDIKPEIYSKALTYCHDRRAMLIVDPPPSWSNEQGAILPKLKSKTRTTLGELNLQGSNARNAILTYPRIRQIDADPDYSGQLDTFAACGMIAGIIARTDATRGVWKAPAGLDASLNGIHSLAVKLTDEENGILNQVGINCLRSFPAAGNVVWGARTMDGDDQLGSEWKYIPVRRTALYIEESLYRGTHWAVFEPNDEPLWAQLRLNIGAFMNDLFRQGAFQGRSPRESYFVKCDKDTTTQNDINRGIVNVVVGFAPLKPAEFVVIKLTQIAGQIET
ncbi:phage tail sheath C-terminal domain-containing protein [Gimesia algae]|uniref:Phage tail sheath protein n=1 Tax=Gimesia algae TaxID=2527971 RepID=A0A517VBS4_9PLAN|nr:phage tail sheath C-terminal domain-containing protein [Gimesia algae]QDT90445.1 Phage tail sheath protein [Gimesia algae]